MAAPRISRQFKFKLLIHFRVLQRCRTWDEWPQAVDTFFQAIRQICHDDEEHDVEEEEAEDHDIPVQKGKRKSQKQATSKEVRDWVEQYFQDNWFIDEWIRESIGTD
jgi:hypothetical protein